MDLHAPRIEPLHGVGFRLRFSGSGNRASSLATLVCSHPPGQHVKKSAGVVEYLSRIVDAKGSRASRLPKRYGLADNFRFDVLHQSELRDRL